MKRPSNHIISTVSISWMSIISICCISGMSVKLNGGGESKDLMIYIVLKFSTGCISWMSIISICCISGMGVKLNGGDKSKDLIIYIVLKN